MESRRGNLVQRFLRWQSVVTVLALGALVVTTGAAATVIGIAQVQIGSSHHGTVNLWDNSWFFAGFVIGVVGLICLLWALLSAWSQAKARNEFPNITIRLDSVLPPTPGPTPDQTKTLLELFPAELQPHDLQVCGIRVTNFENDRYASLQFTLQFDIDAGKYFFQRPFSERAPWTLAPGMTELRPVTFEMIRGVTVKPGTGRVIVIDFTSGRRITFAYAHGDHPRSTWEFLAN